MAAYVGARIMLEALNEAGKSTEMREGQRRGGDKMDMPLGTYGNRVRRRSSTSRCQNTRAFPVIAQWQDGKMVTVFPLEAAPGGGEARGHAGPQVTTADARGGQSPPRAAARLRERAMTDFLNVLDRWHPARRHLLPREHRAQPDLRRHPRSSTSRRASSSCSECTATFALVHAPADGPLSLPRYCLAVLFPARRHHTALHLQPLQNEPMMQVFATFGLLMLLQNIVLAITRGAALSVPLRSGAAHIHGWRPCK